MGSVYDFFVKQVSLLYPQVSGSGCRLSNVCVLRFPGQTVNDLILYQVETQSRKGEPWVPVTTRSMQDKGWFGYLQKPSVVATPALLAACHRHFLQRVLNGQVHFNITEYLALYKCETVRPIRGVMQDQRPVEFWDTLLIRAIELQDDGAYSEQTYGSVKVRQRWLLGHRQPDEPYRTGVVYCFPITKPTLKEVQEKVQSTAQHPSVFVKGQPLTDRTLEVFHTLEPGVAI